MTLTIVTKKQPYVYLEVEEFSVKADEGLTADVKTEDGVCTYTFKDSKEE